MATAPDKRDTETARAALDVPSTAPRGSEAMTCGLHGSAHIADGMCGACYTEALRWDDPDPKATAREAVGPVAFLNAYRNLADASKADEPGGAEYRRVLAEWTAAGRPGMIGRFILDAANRPLSPALDRNAALLADGLQGPLEASPEQWRAARVSTAPTIKGETRK